MFLCGVKRRVKSLLITLIGWSWVILLAQSMFSDPIKPDRPVTQINPVNNTKRLLIISCILKNFRITSFFKFSNTVFDYIIDYT